LAVSPAILPRSASLDTASADVEKGRGDLGDRVADLGVEGIDFDGEGVAALEQAAGETGDGPRRAEPGWRSFRCRS
jgi:hypothetical protein